eukprot:11162428-Lingulodinium_polyedra.AAC.1
MLPPDPSGMVISTPARNCAKGRKTHRTPRHRGRRNAYQLPLASPSGTSRGGGRQRPAERLGGQRAGA